ncbi:MAG: DUF1295 domain-containing protein [Lachnospiraceae bacterium]|nr:DUF1295 domain-containing protein [Lachnospiraceae bacterium]
MNFSQTFGTGFLILLLVALIVSSVGFYKYVYFISLGYGFSIAAMGVTMLIMYRGVLDVSTVLMCLLFLAYGCRLGGYLLLREIKSAAYRNAMKREIKDGTSMKMVAKFSIWISCALLYVLQVSPVLFRLMAAELAQADAVETTAGASDPIAIVGVIIMALGILLESAADAQKSKAKKANPNRFCDTGLYRIVRCPNYLGEVLFWTGVFVSGVTIYAGAWQWIGAAFGYICIVYIMFGGARRLELRQNRNYGQDPEYQAYVKKTPILLPLVPLYSVAKYKWLVG